MAAALVEHVVADAGAFLKKAPLQVRPSVLSQVHRAVTRERGRRGREKAARRFGERVELIAEVEASRSPEQSEDLGLPLRHRDAR